MMFYTVVHIENRYELHASAERDKVVNLQATSKVWKATGPVAAYHVFQAFTEMESAYGATYVWVKPAAIEAHRKATENSPGYQFKE